MSALLTPHSLTHSLTHSLGLTRRHSGLSLSLNLHGGLRRLLAARRRSSSCPALAQKRSGCVPPPAYYPSCRPDLHSDLCHRAAAAAAAAAAVAAAAAAAAASLSLSLGSSEGGRWCTHPADVTPAGGCCSTSPRGSGSRRMASRPQTAPGSRPDHRRAPAEHAFPLNLCLCLS